MRVFFAHQTSRPWSLFLSLHVSFILICQLGLWHWFSHGGHRKSQPRVHTLGRLGGHRPWSLLDILCRAQFPATWPQWRTYLNPNARSRRKRTGVINPFRPASLAQKGNSQAGIQICLVTDHTLGTIIRPLGTLAQSAIRIALGGCYLHFTRGNTKSEKKICQRNFYPKLKFLRATHLS